MTDTASQAFIIVGGAGFIGSHFIDRLLADSQVSKVTIYDNFSSGREWHYAHHVNDTRFAVVRADVHDLAPLQAAVKDHDVCILLAANPDIAAAVEDPDIDFREGTMLTRNVLEAMRQSDCRQLLYASGSGVYGDFGSQEMAEDHGGARPISTYGASKLACEALISAYCHMFGLTARCFRFGNVIGPRQTHGVGYDFVRKLRTDPARLEILGDGKQSKSYIHVDDTVNAVLVAHAECSDGFNVFNAATGDYITVAEIADLAVEALGLDHSKVVYEFTGGDRGWKGDVPVVRLNCDRLQGLGWRCQNSTRQAMRRSLKALVDDLDNNQPPAAGEAR
ncbi:MAG: NAD-dependent epimerase/dehydratase family protein [Rhodospirillales bacterium]|nr:NAD-dependent epimerase/dehydratase family protein [Rhodospirillales bacterium]